jgi:dTDP-4-dehydrorhamnose 3,5-epimerase-like enzyme
LLYRNKDIRVRRGSIPNWMIAEKLRIHENTFYRWMRMEMSEERKQKVITVIEEIKEEMKNGGNQR